MSAINIGLEIGKQLNDYLRSKKQIPYGKPILGSPRLQGWICGFVQEYCDLLNLDEAETHGVKSAVCVTMFDGTSTGQQMGLDVLIDAQRILREGATQCYNQLFLEFINKGTVDASVHTKDANHLLILYTLL